MYGIYVNKKGKRKIHENSYAYNEVHGLIRITKIYDQGDRCYGVYSFASKNNMTFMYDDVSPINIFIAEIPTFENFSINLPRIFPCTDDVIDELLKKYSPVEIVNSSSNIKINDISEFEFGRIDSRKYFDYDRFDIASHMMYKELTVICAKSSAIITLATNDSTPGSISWESYLALSGLNVPIDRTVDWGWLKENLHRENWGKPGYFGAMDFIEKMITV